MFVKNYYETLRSAFKAIGATNDTTVVLICNGSTYTMAGTGVPNYLFPWKTNSANMRASCSPYTVNYNYYVRFGSGTTPASIEDYCLESIITEGLSISDPAKIVFANGDQVESRFVYAVTNTSADDITIGEMTLHCTPGVSTPLVIDRTVLDEPITIPAGETATVTYTISATIPIPSA